MKFLKSTFLLLILFFFLTFSAAALTATWFDGANRQINGIIPNSYVIFTANDMDRDAAFFSKMPINKKQALDRIKNGVVINAFSKDSQSEIKVTVTSDSFAQSIINFSPLTSNEKIDIMNAITAGLQSSGYLLQSDPEIVEQNGYSFIKTNAMIGSEANGYYYTSLSTIIGKKNYDITLFYNNKEKAEDYLTILKTFKIEIDENGDKFTHNVIQVIISYIIIIVSVIVILYVLFFSIKTLKSKLNRDNIKFKKDKK